MKSVTQHLKSLSVAGIFFVSLYTLYAWTGPSQLPPGGNVASPVNTGTLDQIKDGGLSVNAFSAFADSYFAGNVGIGTTTPTSQLHVEGSSPSISLISTATAVKGFFFVGNSGGMDRMVVGTKSNNDMSFATNYSTQMTIKADGNVGIGTTAPNAKLDVAGGIRPIATTVGSSCSPIGAQAYNNSTGAPLYCNGTVWTAVGGGDGVGVGQTWQNMLNSSTGCNRSRNISNAPGSNIVTCNNNTSKPIMVTLTGKTLGHGDYFQGMSVNVNVGGVDIVTNSSSYCCGAGNSYSFVVPNSQAYIVSISTVSSAGAGFANWAELR